jgi:ABC-2 type transport system permease protein
MSQKQCETSKKLFMLKSYTASFICELIKLKRSGVFWGSVIFFIYVPCMFGLMIYIARNPEISTKLGLVGSKAQMFATSNWTAYFNLLCQAIASVGFIGFGFISGWVFGYEYNNRTIKDMLALPVSRTSVVLAKYTVVALWCILLIFLFYSISYFTGHGLKLDGWQPGAINTYSKRFVITSLLTVLLCTPVGLLASYSRGIIAPITFVIITLFLAQFAGILGFGAYFPWSVPGVYSVSGVIKGMEIYIASYIILFATSVLGVLATIFWWQRADQH